MKKLWFKHSNCGDGYVRLKHVDVFGKSHVAVMSANGEIRTASELIVSDHFRMLLKFFRGLAEKSGAFNLAQFDDDSIELSRADIEEWAVYKDDEVDDNIRYVAVKYLGVNRHLYFRVEE